MSLECGIEIQSCGGKWNDGFFCFACCSTFLFEKKYGGFIFI